MRTRIIVGVISMLVASGAFAAEQSWTGAISDKMCGADHKKMGGKLSASECTLACGRRGPGCGIGLRRIAARSYEREPGAAVRIGRDGFRIQRRSDAR